MGGCMQSKNAAVPEPADDFSSGMVTNRGWNFWKMMKDRRSNMIRVAPAPLDYQCVTEVSGRTIVVGVNRVQSPVAIRSPPRCSPRLEDGVPSPSISEEEVRLSPCMITEENADGDQLLELETAARPSTPDLSIAGNPLFVTTNIKKELQARQDGREIIRQLREAGIVARPETKAGGVSYEYFVNEEFALLNKPPVRLQTLKKAKKAQDQSKGDGQLREELASRMEMAEQRRKDNIETVRSQQTQHLVLDIHRAQETSAQLEDEKVLAVAQRLQQKDIMSQVVQERECIGRGIRTMQQKHHRTQVRLRGALNKMADKDEQLQEARLVIQVAPIRDEELDQNNQN